MENLYLDDMYDDVSSPLEFEEAVSQLKKLDKKLHKLKKKKKGCKKSKKKKLRRRIKALELKQDQMQQFMIYTAYLVRANAMSRQGDWWKDTISSSLPPALDFATAVVNRLPERRQSQLLLTDKKKKH